MHFKQYWFIHTAIMNTSRIHAFIDVQLSSRCHRWFGFDQSIGCLRTRDSTSSNEMGGSQAGGARSATISVSSNQRPRVSTNIQLNTLYCQLGCNVVIHSFIVNISFWSRIRLSFAFLVGHRRLGSLRECVSYIVTPYVVYITYDFNKHHHHFTMNYLIFCTLVQPQNIPSNPSRRIGLRNADYFVGSFV